MKSNQAQAAAAIRKELKAAFPTVKFSVTSESFAGGDSVRISWTDGARVSEVEKITSKYQYGHFDGMTDMYEYSNSRSDIPQAKYVQESRTMSAETKELLMKMPEVICYPEGYERERAAYRKFCETSFYTLPEVPKVETKTENVQVVNDVEVVDYSNLSLAVFGNTKPIKEQLKEIGAKFNPYLTREGKKVAGWVISKTRAEKLNSILA